MGIIHRIFDWKGIPILLLLYWVLFIIESRLELRRRSQNKWRRAFINNLISIPSFLLLRFLFLPAMIWLTIKNENIHFGLIYWYPLPLWLETLITFLIFDYANYLWHLLNHRITFLWRFHLVHHTDPDLDLTTALRFHFGEILGSVVFRGAFVLLTGATPLMVLLYEIIFEGEVLFHHSNIRLAATTEKILNFLVVTPRMHGIHHSKNRAETESNFASVLSVWDRLHGTARLNFAEGNPEIGVPSYDDKEQLTVGFLLKLPFTRIRSWTKQDR